MKMNQSGRSMVEMLGVLAIVGVLSVGGIMGYTTAMNRYRASKIMDIASKLSVMSRMASGGAGAEITINDDGQTYEDLAWPNAVGGVTGFTGYADGKVKLLGTPEAKVEAIMVDTAGSGVYTPHTDEVESTKTNAGSAATPGTFNF